MFHLEELYRHSVGILRVKAPHLRGNFHYARSDYHVAPALELFVLGINIGYVETEMRTADIVVMEIQSSTAALLVFE